MRYEIDKQKEYTVFALKEKNLTADMTAELKTELIFLQKGIDNQFIIDLGSVHKCDSSGLSCLLMSERMERDKNRKLILKNVNKNIEDLIKIARLDRVFELSK